MNDLILAQIRASLAALAAQTNAHDEDTDLSDVLAILSDDELKIEDVLRRLVRGVQEAEAFSDAIDDRIKQLQARKSRYENRKTSMRQALFGIMDASEKQKWTDPEFTISIGKPRTSYIVTDEKLLPDEYFRVTKTPDKGKITDDAKQGVIIPGVEETNGMPTMTIRSK
jgi:phosphoenolpyruvate-protein kinase (PTS system EI component)